jgi:tetratricopeptide (TPR) repeat protein
MSVVVMACNTSRRDVAAPLALPDLSHTAPTLAAQIKEAFALAQRKVADERTSRRERGAAYGAVGMLLLGANFRDSAEPLLLTAELLSPDDRKWPYYLGHLYKDKGDIPRADAAFARALQLAPSDIPTLVWLGNARLDEGRADLAEECFTRAVGIDERNAAALDGAGRAALQRGDYGKSAAWFEKALAADGNVSSIHYPLALAYRGLGRLQESAEQLRLKGDITPTVDDPLMEELWTDLESEYALEHLGIRALNRRQFAAAASLFRRAIALAPDDPSLRHRLGLSLALQGDANGAMAQFVEVTRRWPSFPSSHYTLGVLLASQHRYEDAIVQFAAAVQASPNYAEASLQWAESLRKNGHPQEALAHYERVMALDSRLAAAPLGYAIALGALGKDAEAFARLDAATKKYADQPMLAHEMVRMLATSRDVRIRDVEGAVALASNLVSHERPNVDLAEAMAMALAASGRMDDAAVWQRDALTLATRSGDASLAHEIADALSRYQQRQSSRRHWWDDPTVEFASLQSTSSVDPP